MVARTGPLFGDVVLVCGRREGALEDHLAGQELVCSIRKIFSAVCPILIKTSLADPLPPQVTVAAILAVFYFAPVLVFEDAGDGVFVYYHLIFLNNRVPLRSLLYLVGFVQFFIMKGV